MLSWRAGLDTSYRWAIHGTVGLPQFHLICLATEHVLPCAASPHSLLEPGFGGKVRRVVQILFRQVRQVVLYRPLIMWPAGEQDRIAVHDLAPSAPIRSSHSCRRSPHFARPNIWSNGGIIHKGISRIDARQAGKQLPFPMPSWT